MPQLLINANATGDWKPWSGGTGVFQIAGTFAGATASLQCLGPDGLTAIDLGTETTVTAAAATAFIFPASKLRVAITGGLTPALYATVDPV